MRNTKESPETSIWISTTDLMSGLLVIFLFISILMTQAAEESRIKAEESRIKAEAMKGKLQKVTDRIDLAKEELKKEIDRNFSPEDQKKYGMDLGELGSAQFKDGTGTFAAGSYVLTESFKRELDYFLPKYIETINSCNQDFIQEIRIEGHTSSEWDAWGYTPPDVAYIKNMELSQKRTLSVLLYALEMPELVKYRPLINKKMRAMGFSSSNLKMSLDGAKEDKEASRRIEFRVIANDSETLRNIERVMKE